MAKKKTEIVEEAIEQPKVDNTVEKIKVKKPSMKKFNDDPDGITKVDLSKPPKTKEDVQPVDNKETEEVQEKVIEETAGKEEVVEQTPEGDSEQPVLEEITDEGEVEVTQEQVEEAVAEAEATGESVPENIQKLMDFMEDTGGDINDYVKLNRDYSKLENQDLLYEYYKQTKPHLNNEEINFLMEDQVADAKTHLEENKSKYYEDIKAGSKLTSEQQKAVDFFNRYNKESEENQKTADAAKSTFLQKTDNVFNDKFKGFEYNVGDKKFRFNIKDTNETKETQSDINNFVKKFLNKKNEMSDAKGYHKSLFTAMNADAVAKHFYEQGKADAMKNSVAKAKNVNMDPRQSHGEIEAGGLKFKVLGDTSSGFKFKNKQK